MQRGDQDPTSSRSLPPRPAKRPHPRHWLTSGRQTTAKPLNSVIEPWVNVDGDVAAINRGEAVRRGDQYAVNGRTYQLKPSGTLFPVSGDGIHTLRRGAFNALGVYNQFGLSAEAEEFLDRMKIAAAEREVARMVWQAGHTGEHEG
jgi:hypothetical protein